MSKVMSFQDAVALVETVSRKRASRSVAADWSLVNQLAAHWGVSNDTARKRLYRAKKAEEGVISKQIFIHVEDWPAVKSCIAELARKRKAQERFQAAVAAAQPK